MASRYRKKPLAQFEHGTRIYAPSIGDSPFRGVAVAPATRERAFANVATEEQRIALVLEALGNDDAHAGDLARHWLAATSRQLLIYAIDPALVVYVDLGGRHVVAELLIKGGT